MLVSYLVRVLKALIITFLAYFPYFEKIKFVCVCVCARAYVYPPLSLLDNGSVEVPLSLLGNGSIESLPR
jgi:hypothetical protein